MTNTDNIACIGRGFYTIAEAARLLGMPAVNIRRWLGGYSYLKNGEKRQIAPLWKPQFLLDDGGIELDFYDLAELRFVAAFLNAGLKLPAIRNCLNHARQCGFSDRPFLNGKFKTDGKTIFLESAEKSGDGSLLDLRDKQYAINSVIRDTFRDLDIADDMVYRWRPFNGKKSIIIDPQYAFGQPIIAEYGIPTAVLAQAAQAEGSEKAAAEIYEIPPHYVRDAALYERSLAA